MWRSRSGVALLLIGLFSTFAKGSEPFLRVEEVIQAEEIADVVPRTRRSLPKKVLVGYATKCGDDDNKVKNAVRQGVNVVIWAFMYLQPPSSDGKSGEWTKYDDSVLGIDVDCIRNVIQELDEAGFEDTVHLVSMGGWNGPHLNPYYPTAQAWYAAWKDLVGDVFHGMDIDFEGNDDLTSPLNHFGLASLDRTGEILQLAKQDGFSTSIVPAQSYLDIQSSKFSRYVNLTDPTRGDDWHSDFHYFGQNVYAYLLAKYEESIDLIMVQFYESYSRAAMEIHHYKIAPEAYLTMYVQDLANQGQTFFVDFASDPHVDFPSQKVSLPISKLVWGLSNGWAPVEDERQLYFLPECLQAAYQSLWDYMIEPRGLMFWVIDREGKNGVYYAKELNQILHIRKEELNEVLHI